MPRKPRSDSHDQMVEKFAGAVSVLQPPEGITLDSDEERTLWGQFVRARERSSWREFDLVLLAKIVKTEVRLREQQKLADDEGAIVMNSRGTQIENPRLRVVDTLLRQQLAMIRNLSLSVQPQSAQHTNKNGFKADEVVDLSERGAVSFLAIPGGRE